MSADDQTTAACQKCMGSGFLTEKRFFHNGAYVEVDTPCDCAAGQEREANMKAAFERAGPWLKADEDGVVRIEVDAGGYNA